MININITTTVQKTSFSEIQFNSVIPHEGSFIDFLSSMGYVDPVIKIEKMKNITCLTFDVSLSEVYHKQYFIIEGR